MRHVSMEPTYGVKADGRSAADRDPTAKQQPLRRLAATNPAPAVAAKNTSTARDGPDDVESAIMEALSS